MAYSTRCQNLRSDFYKTQALNLNKLEKNFEMKVRRLNGKINASKKCLRRNFELSDESSDSGSCQQKSCERRKPAYCEIITEVCDLGNCFKSLNKKLLTVKASGKFVETDVELLGRNFKQQNCIFKRRIALKEREKKLIMKIFKHLSLELKIYQKKEVEPSIEKEVLVHRVKSHKAREENLENQLNAEAQRLKELFLKRVVELSKPKEKYERIDWKLRTEIQPKIVNLINNIFDSKESLKKIDAEIEILSEANVKQYEIDAELEESFIKLKKNFDELSFDVKVLPHELKALNGQIGDTAMEIESTKKIFNEKISDCNEDALIERSEKEGYKTGMEVQLNNTFDLTRMKENATDCVIKELRRRICCVLSSIETLKSRQTKLLDDIDYLMGRDSKEVVGLDHLGSRFITIKENLHKCQ